jgi:hypothetical protein
MLICKSTSIKKINNMKKLNLFLIATVWLLSSLNVKAQTNVTSSGLSVQGIARDDKNEALANVDQLDLKFEVYYFIGASITPTIILTSTATIKTDNFGVFSYVVGINQDQSSLISSQSAYLRVSSVTTGNVVFSDEKLQTVPYSIYAQNGVPTGSIMPYIGTTAPNGWLLCDGKEIPSGVYYDRLKALAGANTPNLNGMFLRGAGSTTSIYATKTGPALKAVQNESTLAHNHGVSLTTDRMGEHNHNPGSDNYFRALKYDGTGTGQGFDNNTGGGVEPNISTSRAISADGAHTHTVTGSTADSGGTEIRPINYGVNYIIKI